MVEIRIGDARWLGRYSSPVHRHRHNIVTIMGMESHASAWTWRTSIGSKMARKNHRQVYCMGSLPDGVNIMPSGETLGFGLLCPD